MSGIRPYRAFFDELSRLGYVEGQNLAVERYSGEGRPERYAELARDVVTGPLCDLYEGLYRARGNTFGVTLHRYRAVSRCRMDGRYECEKPNP